MTQRSYLSSLFLLAVSSSPFPPSLNRDALFKARNDISAGEIKMFKETISVPAEVHLLVGQKEAEEVFNASEGDSVEFGAFVVRARFSCRLAANNLTISLKLNIVPEENSLPSS